MIRLIGKFEWGLAAIGGGMCLLAIMGITVLTVFGRYILQADLIPGGYNMIGGAFFPLLVFWGLPLAHRSGSFPKLEVIDVFLSKHVARAVGAFVLLCELAVYAVLTWYCAKYTITAFEFGRQLQIGTGYWPSWPVVIMAPLSFGIMMIEVVRLLLRDVRAVFN
ncbi:TRAP-type C4-dicarboxylate transport system, small permease component [Salinihabitans flavidus]|uniref:TRAP transporter small permease protein n=1 Tax=Salinihabitans flavidus TaxID=569882 RepID=A0A1H8UPE2_9RHOB|nr:TRAP transporter small permease [Salinihabitans flavidus]SEP04887.1 TRAP-type C4-dicarboxylate transport system, small permease component [Salinihabitans flavidus]